MGLKCAICDVNYSNVKRFLVHTRIHRHSQLFQCPVPECVKKFGSFASFRKHLRFRHIGPDVEPKKSAHSYKCSLAGCDSTETSFQKIMKHASNHISCGQPVFCPLQCPTKKPFATSNSLRIHKMYAHRAGLQKSDMKRRPEDSYNGDEESDCEENEGGECSVNTFDQEDSVGETNERDGAGDDGDPPPILIVEKIFGCLFLKLLSKHHVPNSAIQEIVEAIGEATRVQDKYLSEKVEELTKRLDMSDVSGLVLKSELRNGQLMGTVFESEGVFRSAYMRKKFFSENFSYVPPVEISLQRNEDHTNCFYFYVPILDTIRGLLNDKIVYEAMFGEKLQVPGYISDYTDGLKFQKSSFFNRKTVNIFIYQDAAEVVPNQLGNATGRHKLLLVYMVLGNLPPHLRCLTDNVQLVLVCRNKDFAFFGASAIFRRLIEDLRVLEDDGVVVHGGGAEETIYGSVFATMNDNLGAHQLAGLSENFSRNSFFCRTCYSTLESFRRDPYEIAVSRTPELNKQDLRTIESDPECKVPYRGVKVSCIFDELKYFQMFDLGAVPCVAHDLFEGWVNYDLFMIFKRIVKSGITRCYLQGRINSLFKQLKISTKIELNFTRKACNIKAKACDVWHLVQIIPFIFLKKDINYSQPEIIMLLLIKKVTDIITSPIQSTAQIKILETDLEEYIELRTTHFKEALRPKHHYTLHYPRYILWLGPIISYCTLFCERKHCFFKRCIRTTINFKNVVKFSSEQHQYYQGLLNTQTERLKNNFLLEKYVESISSLPKSSQTALHEFCLDNDQNVFVEQGTFMGYTYSAGDYLFLRHDEYGEWFYVVKIKLLVLNPKTESVTVFGNELIAVNIFERGIIEISESNEHPEKLICLSIEDFVDRAPLLPFVESNKVYLFIKHSIPPTAESC